MVRSKFGLKALGLCAVLVGVMAFASVAQAESTAFWEVNGAKLAGEETVLAEKDVQGVLLTELGGKQIHIICLGEILVNGVLVGTQVRGFIIFHECEFFELVTPGGTTKQVAACTPLGKTITTNKINGLITLHEGKGTVEAVPAEAGKPFATIELGEECAFGERITVGGKFFLKDEAFTTNAVKHLVEELKALTKLTINGGEKTATIDGSAWAFLGGANKGKAFSGHPG